MRQLPRCRTAAGSTCRRSRFAGGVPFGVGQQPNAAGMQSVGIVIGHERGSVPYRGCATVEAFGVDGDECARCESLMARARWDGECIALFVCEERGTAGHVKHAAGELIHAETVGEL